MLTGDLISDLPYMSITSSMVFPYADQQVLENFSKIFLNPGSDRELSSLRRMLMQNLNWNIIISRYSEFKQDNSGMNSFAKFVSGTLDTFKSSSRRKRQLDTFQSNDILNMSQIENVMAVLQSMNITVIEDLIVSLASELSLVMRELVTMSELMANTETEDVAAIITMVTTSPQLARITQRISLMMEKLEPFMKDSEYMPMFQSVRESFSTLNNFFQNSTLILSNIVNNWQNIEDFVIQEKIFSQKELQNIADALISPQLLFTLFQKLEDFQCNEEDVTRYVEFYKHQALLNTSLQSMVEATCGFVQSEHLVELLFVLDLDSAVDYLMSVFQLSPSSLASSSDLTQEELQTALDSLNAGLDIFPEVLESLTLLKDRLNVTEFNVSSVSLLFCGKEFTQDTFNYEVMRVV